MVTEISTQRNVLGAFLAPAKRQPSDSLMEKIGANYSSNIEDSYIGSKASTEKFQQYISKQVNSFEDFVNNYKALVPQNSHKENIDYDNEFKEFLNSKGCKDETELEALNKAGFDTVDELKKNAKISMAKTLIEMKGKGEYIGDINEDIDYIINNSSVQDIAQYRQNALKGDIEAKQALENLIKKLPQETDDKKEKRKSLLNFFK